MKKQRSGRAVFDKRGNATWEWQVAPGVYSRDVGTSTLKILLEDDAISSKPATPAVEGADPYRSTATPPSPPRAAPARRRTPADMRKLSNAIVAARGVKLKRDNDPEK
jgi:hypothetical protein